MRKVLIMPGISIVLGAFGELYLDKIKTKGHIKKFLREDDIIFVTSNPEIKERLKGAGIAFQDSLSYFNNEGEFKVKSGSGEKMDFLIEVELDLTVSFAESVRSINKMLKE